MEGGTKVSESVKQYPELSEREKAVFRAIMEQYIQRVNQSALELLLKVLD